MPRVYKHIDINAKEKSCTACGEEKPIGEFYSDKTKTDGRTCRCKKCIEEAGKKRYQNNPSKYKVRSRHWAVQNKEKVRENLKRYNAENREYLNLKKRERYPKNKEAIAARTKKWSKQNPQKRLAIAKRRRARRAGVEVVDFTNEQWLDLQKAFDHRCAYCGKRFKGKLVREHITPISKGGHHTLSNIVPSCQPCNAKKGVGAPLAPVQPLLITVPRFGQPVNL